jgi:hypothetical protein
MVGRSGDIVMAVKDADDLVPVDLTEMERSMLSIGLSDWGGPAYCEDSLAQVLGFRDVQNLYDEGYPSRKPLDAVSPSRVETGRGRWRP